MGTGVQSKEEVRAYAERGGVWARGRWVGERKVERGGGYGRGVGGEHGRGEGAGVRASKRRWVWSGRGMGGEGRREDIQGDGGMTGVGGWGAM